MKLNLYITAALFGLLILIINLQVKSFNKLTVIQTILEENLLPPLPEWEEQQN
jgi:hypothetical protein